MALTDTAIRGAKPGTKPFKIYDREGLFLLVNPSGSKLWRWQIASSLPGIKRNGDSIKNTEIHSRQRKLIQILFDGRSNGLLNVG